MPSPLGYYNAEEYKEKRQGDATRMPPKANLLAAASHVRSLFEGKRIAYAVMGGFEMLCLGHRRDIPGLQIAYDNKDYHRMRSKLEGDRRYACVLLK